MKTIREWLEELPEPYRTQALENDDPGYSDYRTTVESLTSALERAFDWERSPQGHYYWQEITYKN